MKSYLGALLPPVLKDMKKKRLFSKKVIVVTGGAWGIGRNVARAFAREGATTVITNHDDSKAKSASDFFRGEGLNVHRIGLDLSQPGAGEELISSVIKKWRRIDVLVNNAGYSLIGALEDLSMDEIKAQFETNLFGTIRVMKAVLPTMRKQKGGTIVNVSSMAGRVGFPLFPVYSGTKFALEGVSESIRLETDPLGIKIVLVEPGTIRSNFASNAIIAQKAAEPASPYASLMETLQKATARFVDQGTPPEEVAKVILKAVTIDNPDLRYLVGNDAIQMIEARKGMSDQEFGVVVKEHLLGQ